MTNELEQMIRQLVNHSRFGHKLDNYKQIIDKFDAYVKEFTSRPLTDPFYVFDRKYKGYYKVFSGEGWFFEGVVFKDPDFALESETEECEDFCAFVNFTTLTKDGRDKNLHQIANQIKMGTKGRFYLITSGIFADALLEYIKHK